MGRRRFDLAPAFRRPDTFVLINKAKTLGCFRSSCRQRELIGVRPADFNDPIIDIPCSGPTGESAERSPPSCPPGTVGASRCTSTPDPSWHCGRPHGVVVFHEQVLTGAGDERLPLAEADEVCRRLGTRTAGAGTDLVHPKGM